MTVESATYLNDLNAANPASNDPKSEGDNHLRLIKQALLNTFSGFAGAILATGTDGGAVNAYTITSDDTLPAYGTKMIAIFSPTVTNTGASTLNIDSLGVVNVKDVDGDALTSGDLVAGSLYIAIYNGSEFRLLSPTMNQLVQLAMQTALPAQTLGLLISDATNASFSKTLTGFALNEVKGADIASAATIDLTAATGNLVHITGTTGITAITIGSGAERTLVFDGVLTITHHATTLILPGGVNITTAAGDVMIVRGDGSGNARVISYVRANGTPVAGSLVRLAELTPTASANLDFLTTFTSSFDTYEIDCEGITSASTDTLLIRLANSGSVDSGSNYVAVDTGSSSSTTATSFSISAFFAPGTGGNLKITIRNANDSSSRIKSIEASGVVNNTTNSSTSIRVDKAAAYIASAAVSGGRLFWSGGANFGATGRVRVYGVQNN